MTTALHILVLEDEQTAGEKLVQMVQSQAPNAKIDWLRTVQAGIDFLRYTQPDLIFSDIELLDGQAFQVYQSVTPACPIIFCTAFDAFYVDAFQTNGIAYLLKPYNSEEFQAAWDKFERLFQPPKSAELTPRLLEQLSQLIQQPTKKYKTTFTAKKSQGVLLLKTVEIRYFQAQSDFVLAFDQKGKKHVLNHKLSELERLLDPQQFFRINRSEIVHFSFIQKFEPYIKNRLAIYLTGTSTFLYTSNSRSAAFRAWLER